MILTDDVSYVLGLERKLQQNAENQPMSREEVKATLMKVRSMRDRIHFIASGTHSNPGF